MQNQWQHIKQTIKKSGFVVEAARTARAGVLDLKQLYWRAIRGGKIRSYLSANRLRKLQLGASFTPLSGWLNTDLILEGSGVVYLDATRLFPFDDDTFDYIACEHMIEHIDYAGALTMLRESFRVLKPGGKIRIATPDLRVITGLCAPEKTEAQAGYIEWITARLFPDTTDCKAVFVVNNAFRCWGHQFLYDTETLKTTLARCGFEDFEDCTPGDSNDPQLRGIESHGRHMGSEAMNQFETIVVEAHVPDNRTGETKRPDKQWDTAALAAK